jgi:hypothetical protein
MTGIKKLFVICRPFIFQLLSIFLDGINLSVEEGEFANITSIPTYLVSYSH